LKHFLLGLLIMATAPIIFWYAALLFISWYITPEIIFDLPPNAS
jgi:hypothetical protein